MSKPPMPIFMFFGIAGGATCSCVENDQLFVGSQTGVVKIFGIKSKLIEGIVYEDKEERRIQSLEFSKNLLYIYVRNFAVLQLKRHENSAKEWEITLTVEVDHVGFCNSIIVGSKLLFPSTDVQRYSTLCWTDLSEVNVKAKQITEHPDIAPMCMLFRDEEEEEVLIGMEDGCLAISSENCGGFEFQTTMKLGREPVFCIASCSKWVAAGCSRSPIFLINRNDLSKQEIPYLPDAGGCSAIAFSTNTKQVLAGFWDGSIRVFSRLRLTVLLVLSHSHSSTISSLHWSPSEYGDLMIATSSDSTVTMWKLK